MSAGFLGACIRLHRTLDHRDHGNALAEGQRTDALMEFRQDPEVKLQPFWRRRQGAILGNAAAVRTPQVSGCVLPAWRPASPEMEQIARGASSLTSATLQHHDIGSRTGAVAAPR